ncbi:MAG: nitroreductase family protein, partial [Elusimicrobiota bacterium]|nr:nitroreductase family protein [Elusimicrobiota bacterium]
FIYINDKTVLTGFAELGTAHFVQDANQAILVLYDNRIDNEEYNEAVLSAGAVIENMLLKAADLNIAACLICNLPTKRKVRTYFAIPYYYDPIALITIGYAVKHPETVKRKHILSSIIHYNAFDINKDAAEYKSKIKLFVRKYARKIYVRLPKYKWLVKMASRFERKFKN